MSDARVAKHGSRKLPFVQRDFSPVRSLLMQKSKVLHQRVRLSRGSSSRPIAGVVQLRHGGTMRYQDLKIRDAGRLAAISVGLALIVGLSCAFRQQVEPVVNMLPMRSREPFLPLLFALGTLAILSAGMAVYYLVSSPAQNASYLARMIQKGQHPGDRFDASLLEPSDPDYGVRTWDYLRRRSKPKR